MKLTLQTVRGCFGLLRRRVAAVGCPALQTWTDLGEQAAVQVGAEVRRLAHAAEVADREAGRHLAAGIEGLGDGRIDAEDIENLRRAERSARRSAELAQDISEVVR